MGADPARHATSTPIAPEQPIVAINMRDLALIVTITADGKAQADARIPKPAAAGVLRYIADQWDPPTDREPAPPPPAPEGWRPLDTTTGEAAP